MEADPGEAVSGGPGVPPDAGIRQHWPGALAGIEEDKTEGQAGDAGSGRAGALPYLGIQQWLGILLGTAGAPIEADHGDAGLNMPGASPDAGIQQHWLGALAGAAEEQIAAEQTGFGLSPGAAGGAASPVSVLSDLLPLKFDTPMASTWATEGAGREQLGRWMTENRPSATGPLSPGFPASAGTDRAEGRDGGGLSLGPEAEPVRPEPVRLTLDWVRGHDPWATPNVWEGIQAALARLERAGLPVILERGIEVTLGARASDHGRRAAELTVRGPHGPVSLGALGILEGAVVRSESPAGMRFLLRPGATMAGSLEGAAGLDSRPGPVEPVRIILDWVAGEAPAPVPEPGDLDPGLIRQLEERGLHIEWVRGEPVPASRFEPDLAMEAGVLSVGGPQGPVSLADLPWLNGAVPIAHRPGQLRLLLPPAAFSDHRPTDSPVAASPFLPRGPQMTDLRPVALAMPGRDAMGPAAMTGLGMAAAQVRIDVFEVEGWPQGPALEFAGQGAGVSSPATAMSSFDLGPGGATASGAFRSGFPSLSGMSSGPSPAATAAGPMTLPPLGRSDVALAATGRTGVQAVAPGSYPGMVTNEVSGPQAEAASAPNVDLLARQVYALIKQRLVVERERLGANRGLNGW